MPNSEPIPAGGGRKVIRCEVSLDGGDTWRLADIERHEKPTPYNKHWCWVFWNVAVPAVDLLRAAEIRVRAVDSSNNMMPEKCENCLSRPLSGHVAPFVQSEYVFSTGALQRFMRPHTPYS